MIPQFHLNKQSPKASMRSILNIDFLLELSQVETKPDLGSALSRAAAMTAARSISNMSLKASSAVGLNSFVGTRRNSTCHIDFYCQPIGTNTIAKVGRERYIALKQM